MKKNQEKQVERLLGAAEVCRRLGVSRATLHAERGRPGKWPNGVLVSARRRVWRESEITAYIDSIFALQEKRNAKKSVA